MTFYEIKQNIRNWDDIRGDSEIIKSLLTGSRFFKFTPQIPLGATTADLHFYPAVENQKFIFYIINTAYDNPEAYEEDPSMFLDFISKAELQEVSKDELEDIMAEIPEEEARQRISNWNTNYSSFIEKNAGSEFFQAFSFSASNEGLNDMLVGLFGLDNIIGSIDQFFNVDLILVNSERSFFNTVWPVPPFGTGGKEAFFLLNAATEEISNQ